MTTITITRGEYTGQTFEVSNESIDGMYFQVWIGRELEEFKAGFDCVVNRTVEPDIIKFVEFNGDDYDAFVSIDGKGEYIGSARTRAQAEQKASEYILDYYEHSHTPEKVAQLIMAEA